MKYTKQDLIKAGIPENLTIETIHNECRQGGLTQLPGRTMCKTILQKYPGIRTVGDLFENSPQNRHFMDFQKGVLSMAPTLKAVYDASVPRALPLSGGYSSLEEGLRRFLPDYCSEKRRRAVVQKKAVDNYCRVLELYFDENSFDNSDVTIGRALGMTPQNVDDKLSQAREELAKLFLGDLTIEGVFIDKQLSDMVKAFRNAFTVPASVERMKELSGIDSPRMLDLLSLILGLYVQKSGIVRDADVYSTGIRLNIGKVKSMLKKEGIPVSLEDFDQLVHDNFADAGLADDLVTFAKGSNEFEIIQKDNREFIAVRWEYLGEMASELVRILYDNEAWTPASAMSKDELQREWERRARLAGRRDIQYKPRYSNWRMYATKTGCVMLKRSRGQKLPTAKEYVFGLVLRHPGWTFDDVLTQAVKDGYANLNTAGSLKSYFTAATAENKVEDALKGAIRVLDYAKGNTLPLRDLYGSIPGIKVKFPVLRRWILLNPGTFSYFSIPGKKASFVKLLSKQMPLVLPKKRL